MLGLPGTRWEVGCGGDCVVPGRGEGGGGGGGDRSLNCPPPVEAGSEEEEAQTENTPRHSDWAWLDKAVLIPEGCCSRCSRQSAGCPPCPPPSPSPGLSGRRHYPRWPHCSPGPASSEYFLSKVITILAREYWERQRWRKKERFSLISSSMEKKPENCLSKQEAGRFNLKFCFEQMSGRRKSWRSFIIIFFCKSDLTCPL